MNRSTTTALLGAAAFTVAIAFTAGAGATVMMEVPLEEMIANADAIVHARVERVGVRLQTSGRLGAMPHTRSTLRVIEWIKRDGEAERIVIDEIGGQMQQSGVEIAGTPRYAVGDEVIVFLRRVERGDYRTLAMVQGRFEVLAGVPGTADVVVRDTSAIGLASWGRAAGMTIDHGGVRAMPLAQFRAYVLQMLAQLPRGADRSAR